MCFSNPKKMKSLGFGLIIKNEDMQQCFSEEDCNVETSLRHTFSNNLEGTLDNEGVDHSFVNIFCDQDLKDPRRSGVVWKSGGSCIGGKNVHNLLVDYSLQFLENYKEVPKFMTISFKEGMEPTQMRIKTMDQDLTNFFRTLKKNGYLNNTALIFLSDQGNFQSPYFEHSRFGKLEHKQPFLFFTMPSEILKKAPKLKYHLIENQNQIITSLDIYRTLVHLPTYHESHKSLNRKEDFQSGGYSLFGHIPSRNCEDAGISEELCMCEDGGQYLTFLFLVLPVLIMVWWCFTWFWGRKLEHKKKRTISINNIRIS